MAAQFETVENSSNVKAAHYDPATERCLVHYKNGAVYPYEPVTSELYEEFRITFDGSYSAGVFINTYMRRLAGARLSADEVEALGIEV